MGCCDLDIFKNNKGLCLFCRNLLPASFGKLIFKVCEPSADARLIQAVAVAMRRLEEGSDPAYSKDFMFNSSGGLDIEGRKAALIDIKKAIFLAMDKEE